MLVALINKSKQGEQKPDSPITVDLSQTKPARKQAVRKSTAAKKEKIITDNTAELKATIDRIFADEDAILITTQEQLLDFLRQQEVFGLDTETTGLYFYKDKIAGFSLGTATRSAYIPLNHTKGENYKDDLDIMCEILLERRYYGFNAQFDWHFLEKFKPQLRGLELAGEGSIALRCYDITLPHRLKEVYREVIDPTYEEYSFTKLFKGKAFTEYDPKDVFKYAAVDARKHYVVTEYFENKLRSEMPQVYERYRRIELRVLKPLYETEKYGMCLDRALVQQRYDELEAKKVPLLEKTKELSGDPNFNPGSPKQVREAFARFGIYLNSTNEEALASLDSPLAKAILDYREAIKLQGTYTTNLFEFTDVDEEGNTIIHPSFDSMGADCVVGDTLVITREGMKKIADVCPKASSGEYTPFEVDLLNENGEFERTSTAVTFEDVPTKRVQLPYGLSIEGTYNHPIRVIGHSRRSWKGKPTALMAEQAYSNIQWKMLSQIQPGEYVLLKTG